MRDFLDKVKEVFDREWSGEEKVLIMLCCVLLGVIYGFLTSPIKKGISVGNNNGNNYNEYADDYWLDDEEQNKKLEILMPNQSDMCLKIWTYFMR